MHFVDGGGGLIPGQRDPGSGTPARCGSLAALPRPAGSGDGGGRGRASRRAARFRAAATTLAYTSISGRPG